MSVAAERFAAVVNRIIVRWSVICSSTLCQSPLDCILTYLVWYMLRMNGRNEVCTLNAFVAVVSENEERRRTKKKVPMCVLGFV